MALERDFITPLHRDMINSVIQSEGLLLGSGDSLFPTPIAFMPLESDLSLAIGVGSATFTRTTTGTFVDKDDGLVKTAAIDVARFEVNGVLIEGGSENEALHNRDFTNAVHVKNGITPVKNAIGADGVVNAASTLTATSPNGTVFQTITKSSATNTMYVDVRRKTGSGTIEISDDGGSTFTGITSSINLFTYTRFQITTTQVNPSIGFRMATSGDEIEVDYLGLEDLPFASSRIETTTTAVTRTADNLSIDSDNIPGPTEAYSVSASVDVLGLNTGSSQRIYNVAGESLRFFNAGRSSDSKINARHGSVNVDTILTLAPLITNKMVIVKNTNLDIFVNGLSTTGAIQAVTGAATAIEIGNGEGVGQLYGHIKDFRIYNVALSSAQVSKLG